MQITYKYYRFPTKNEIPKLEEWPINVSYSNVGTIYDNDAEYDELGNIIKPQTPKPGWHINVSYNTNPLVNLDFIKQYEIDVKTPRYLWLGQEV